MLIIESPCHGRHTRSALPGIISFTSASFHRVSPLFRTIATPFPALRWSGSSLFHILNLRWNRLFKLFTAASSRCDSCITRTAIFLSRIIWFTCVHLSWVAADPPPLMFNVASFITPLIFFFLERPGCWLVSPLCGFAWSLGGGGRGPVAGVETWEEVVGPSLLVSSMGFRVGGMRSGSGSSLGVWADLFWFPPGLSLELLPTDGSTALPVLGGLVRQVPPTMLILFVTVTL